MNPETPSTETSDDLDIILLSLDKQRKELEEKGKVALEHFNECCYNLLKSLVECSSKTFDYAGRCACSVTVLAYFSKAVYHEIRGIVLKILNFVQAAHTRILIREMNDRFDIGIENVHILPSDGRNIQLANHTEELFFLAERAERETEIAFRQTPFELQHMEMKINELKPVFASVTTPIWSENFEKADVDRFNTYLTKFQDAFFEILTRTANINETVVAMETRVDFLNKVLQETTNVRDEFGL